jgi:hypothetical protein
VSGEIEFLEPEPAPGTPPQPHPSRASSWVAVLGWTAASVLAVVAPFQRLYGNGTALPRRYADYLAAGGGGAVDGWGNGASVGPRFGVALVVCAAVCAVLTLGMLARVITTSVSVPRRVLSAVSVAAPCLLAGVIGTMALFLASHPDTPQGWTAYAASGLQFVSPETYSSHLMVTFATNRNGTHSSCLWLAVAALACAVLAAVAQSVANRAYRDLAG